MANTTPPPHSRATSQPIDNDRSPPPPPPLPPLPQRYSQRAATAIAKLAPPWLTSHHSRSSSPRRVLERTSSDGDDASPRPGITRYRSHVQRSSSPASSRSAVHRTGIHIAAIDVSPSRTHAVLAGRKILKTVRVGSNGTATEDINIRSSIVAYASANSSSRIAVAAKHQDQLAATDVRWSNGRFEWFIATAVANGRIVLYDLNRPGLEVCALTEHTRQVHKLAFNPFGGELLLSGGQDGGIKLWDLRNATSLRKSERSFNGHDQGVRDVKWSTRDGVEFAAGTEGGVVQRWDMRKPNVPIVKLKAHDKTCHSIDYHPGGKHLATAGADRNVKVWDTTRSDKRQNPTWTIHAPQIVSNVRWRPCVSTRGEDGELVAGPSAQIATTYDHDPRIHVWDFRRPNVPYQEIDRYETPATDILWHSEDLLWSVGSIGMFTQTDLDHVPKPVDRLKVNCLAVAPDSNFVMYSNPRKMRQRMLPETQRRFLQRTDTNGSSGEKLGSSASANEGSFDEASLLASTLRRRRKKAASQRLLTGISRNSDDAAFGQVEQPLILEPIIETTQTGIHGRVRGIFDAKAFQYLAEHYEPPGDLEKFSDWQAIAKHLEALFLKNSKHAIHAGDHGLAHIWRILAWAVKKELEDWPKDPDSKRPRQELRQRSRMHSDALTAMDMVRSASASTARDHTHLQSPLSILAHESGSNVPTPRVRPATGHAQVPALPPGSLGDEPADKPRKHDLDMPHLLPTNVTDLRQPDRPHSSDRVPHIKFEDSLLTPSNISGQGKSGPRPIPGSSHVDMNEASASLQQHLDDTESSPAFSYFEEQLAAKRAALSEYRHIPRPVLNFGDTTREFLSTPLPASPTRAINVPRPGLDRYDSGESFNLLSESAGSYQTSLPMSSFEESPGKDSKGISESEQRARDQEIEDRFLVPELGKQAAAEETEKLLQELSSSSRPDVPAIPVDDAPEAPVEQQEVVGGARRPNRAAPTIHKAEKDVNDSVSGRSEDEGSRALFKHASSDEYFRHAVVLPHSDPKPWHASTFLPSLLSHYLNQLSFIQLPTMLALYLHPIYPSLFPTHKYLSSSAFSVEDFHPSGNALTVSHLTAVLLSYHAQLVSLKHYIPATELRRSCASTFPEVSRQATPGIVAGYWCRTCQKPSKGKRKGECTRCSRLWGGCMVCGDLRLRPKQYRAIKTNAKDIGEVQNEKAEADSVDPKSTRPPLPPRSHYRPKAPSRHASHAKSLPERPAEPRRRKNKGNRWTYCSTCDHGGHASCLSAWFSTALSRGACAIAGCTHACAPGALREEQRAERAREKAERTQLRRGAGVLRDERMVRESRAVKEVRGAVAAGGEGVMLPLSSGGNGNGSGGVGLDIGVAAGTRPRPAPTGIPMESVRDVNMLDGERMGIGMGKGRGRGRWRNSGGAGQLPVGGGGGRGAAATGDLNRRGPAGGRNSMGTAVSIRPGQPSGSVESSTESSSAGVREFAGIGGAGGGGILGAGGATRGLRRVRLLEPGAVEEEDDNVGRERDRERGREGEGGRGRDLEGDEDGEAEGDRDSEVAVEFAESTASSSVP